jgi:crossover junction endodeoxyribonuclease RuvC
MRLLAFDPGLNITGYACFAPAADNAATPALLEAGCFRLRSAQEGEAGVAARLAELDRDAQELIERVAPTDAVVESLFAHARYPGSAIIASQARGVLLRRLAVAGVRIAALPPATVKKAVTGSGQAGKGQVQRAVASILSLDTIPEPADVADAMAIGLAAWSRLALSASG